MALHLIKLCVGVSEVDQLTAWGRRERGKGSPPVVHTRMTPKRVGELLEGGSLYWVIKGVVQCRQRIIAIDTIDEGAQRSRCEITLDDEVVRVAPQRRGAFQGWRYYEGKDVTPDLASWEAGEAPPELAEALRELGAW
ncbi:MAG: DUF1489 domain-containing protein [Caulobacteraceae bacterium]|nr:DUF1489 domain-containing protein [Caulobacteraceae bacterium]